MNMDKLLSEIKILKEQIKQGNEPSYFHLKGIRQTMKMINDYQNNITCTTTIEETEMFQKIKDELEID